MGAVWHDGAHQDWSVRADLQVGDRLFGGGAAARAIAVPEALRGRTWISPDLDARGFPAEQTPLGFALSEPAEVQVCHDARAATIPAWLADWRDTGAAIAVQDGAESWSLRCRARSFAAGEVRLGGPGAAAPYLVAFGPSRPEPAVTASAAAARDP
jgi:hypothetical protein